MEHHLARRRMTPRLSNLVKYPYKNVLWLYHRTVPQDCTTGLYHRMYHRTLPQNVPQDFTTECTTGLYHRMYHRTLPQNVPQEMSCGKCPNLPQEYHRNGLACGNFYHRRD